MPIKSMIRIFWVGNALLLLLLILSVFLIFSSSEAAPIIKPLEIPPLPQTQQETKHPMEYYSDIWNVNINTNPPPAAPEAVVPSDWHKQLLERYVKINGIPSNGYAIVAVNNQEPKLLESLNDRNKNDSSKPWEINVSGHRVIVQEIIRGKGIKFKFEQSNREVWLEHKETNGNNNQNPNHEATSLGPNQWSITSDEGTEILKSTDKYVEEMAPQIEYDSNGNPLGIKLRRVLSNSKAFNFGLRENDVIKSINGSPMNSLSPDYVRRLIENHRQDKNIVVNLMRNNQPVSLTFDIRR